MNSFMSGPSQSLTPDPPACNKVAQTLFWEWLKSSLNVVSDWAKLAEYFHKDEINVTCKLTGDRRQARHFHLAKQFCFLDADCLVVGESQGSSRRSVGKYPVKPPRPEGDSQTIGSYRCRNH